MIDYQQLKQLLGKNKIKESQEKIKFDRFYNDYTKIYPLSGGLTKTAKIKSLLKWREYKIVDGWSKVQKLLLNIKNNPKKYKNLRFLDVTFCEGGCIGGPCTNRNLSIRKKRKLVKKYMRHSLKEKIPEDKKGIISKAEGISFIKKY